MENFLNRINIYYLNIFISEDIKKKEEYLNKLINIVQKEKNTISIINFIYSLNPQLFSEYLYAHRIQYVLFLTYDTSVIYTLLNIDENHFIKYENNLFTINKLPKNNSINEDIEKLNIITDDQFSDISDW
jgi:hypothetical protein